MLGYTILAFSFSQSILHEHIIVAVPMRHFRENSQVTYDQLWQHFSELLCYVGTFQLREPLCFVNCCVAWTYFCAEELRLSA